MGHSVIIGIHVYMRTCVGVPDAVSYQSLVASPWPLAVQSILGVDAVRILPYRSVTGRKMPKDMIKALEKDRLEQLTAVEELVRLGALESKDLVKYKQTINDAIDKMLSAHAATVN